MTIDTARLLRAVVLLAWAGFFAWLLVSGEVYRYIGPRTYWVVVFGAAALSMCAIGYLLTVRRATPRPSTARDTFGALVMLVPLLVVLLVPRPSLGSLAASKKLTGAPVTAGTFQPRTPGPGEAVSFPEIEYASQSQKYAATVGISDGYPVTLTGFVTHPAEPSGDYALTRFAIFCCAADVVPHSVAVDGDRDREEDSWLQVRGTLAYRDGRYVLVADDVEEVAEPNNPYIR